MRIAVLSCDPLPEPDPDEAPLRSALGKRGASVTVLPWDRPDVDWSTFDRVVVRATWDYHRRPEAFLATLRSIDRSTTLINPLAVVHWNHHKRYLLQLASAGLPVVPTRCLSRGAEPPRLSMDQDWVIKPAVSGSSWETRCLQGLEARSFLRDSLRSRDTLVQPALPGFADPGELSLVFLGGTFHHAVRKHPRFADDDEQVEAVEHVDEHAIAVAGRALDELPAAPTFARVDLVVHDGGPCISELEAIEPSLFLAFASTAAGRLADLVIQGGSHGRATG